MKARILAILGALVLAAGFVVGSVGTANAQMEDQLCYDGFCLNAWNGGPYVNEYTPGVVNNNFDVVPQGNGIVGLEFVGNGVGSGGYQTQCIADYGNSPTDARAGLSGQCAFGQIAWGANFKLTGCSTGGLAFKNVHWGGWLAPAGLSDGTAYYLNSTVMACFVAMPPVLSS